MIGDCRSEIFEGKTDPKSQIVTLQSEIKGFEIGGWRLNIGDFRRKDRSQITDPYSPIRDQ
jgi:hypothetical protein